MFVQAVGSDVYVADVNNSRIPVFTCASGTAASSGVSQVAALREGPTVTENGELLQEVVASPNVSVNGEAVNIKYRLNQSAGVKLRIYALTGQLVYAQNGLGTAGMNELDWNVDNRSRQKVASGLYIYVFDAQGGNQSVRKIGKILVLH